MSGWIWLAVMACGGASSAPTGVAPEAASTTPPAGGPVVQALGAGHAGCADGKPSRADMEGHTGPKPPLDDDGLFCGAKGQALHITHLGTDIGSVADRYTRHMHNHDWTVPGFGKPLPNPIPEPYVRTATHPTFGAWRFTFATRGEDVDVVQVPDAP